MRLSTFSYAYQPFRHLFCVTCLLKSSRIKKNGLLFQNDWFIEVIYLFWVTILCQIYVLWIFSLSVLSFDFLVVSFNEIELILMTSFHIYLLSIPSRCKSHKDIKLRLLSYCSSIPYSKKLWQLCKSSLKAFQKDITLFTKVFFFTFIAASDFLLPAPPPLTFGQSGTLHVEQCWFFMSVYDMGLEFFP